jgi:photosystem II stability/assembly factor-like uncharacterized protein
MNSFTRAAIAVWSASLAWSASWTPINSGLPGVINGVSTIWVDPSNASILYARTVRGALFKSADAAGSWNRLNMFGQVSFLLTDPRGFGPANSLAIDPKNSSVLYVVSTSGIVTSANGGETWSDPVRLANPAFMLAIDPIVSSTIYAATANGILKSTDGGTNWITADNGLPASRSIQFLLIDPFATSTIYAVRTNGEIFKTTDGGESWTSIKTGAARNFGAWQLTLVLDPVNPSTIYAGSFANFENGLARGISKSTDGGVTWKVVERGLPPNAFIDGLALDPTSPSTIFARANTGTVVKSIDGGESWTILDLNLPPGNHFVAPAAGSSTVYAGYYILDPSGIGGVSKSNDGGLSWSAASAGMFALDLRVLATDPVDPLTIYTGGAAGLFRSIDGGANWTTLSKFEIAEQPLPPDIPPFPFSGGGPGVVRSLVIDPADAKTLYLGTTRSNGCIFTEKLLFKSIDGGVSWSDGISPPQSGCILSAVLSRASGLLVMDPADSKTLYLNAADDIDEAYWLLKSTDSGASWNFLDVGSFPGINALVMGPAALYLGTGDGFQPGAVLASTDNGTNWNSLVQWEAAVTTLAVDPADSAVLYAGTEGLYAQPRGFRGLYKSSDRGASWLPINEGLGTLSKSGASITSLVISPANSNVAYAATSLDGVYKTVDGGASWFKFSDGLTASVVRALTIRQGVVYAATSGGVFKIEDETASGGELR